MKSQLNDPNMAKPLIWKAVREINGLEIKTGIKGKNRLFVVYSEKINFRIAKGSSNKV